MKTVIVCPLNWGLGHASRDVEIISKYIKQGYNVIIGADKAPLEFLRHHFPDLQHVVIRGVSVKYSKLISFKVKMLISLPQILYGIYREHRDIKKIIKKHCVDIIVSDNRYGLWNKNIHSIFITHQLWVRVSKIVIIEKFANYINRLFIEQYDECWVPDYKGNKSVAGELSNPPKLPKNVKYMGLLSRFKEELEYNKSCYKEYLQSQNYDVLVIISGPEPQRTVFEKIIIRQIYNTNYKTLILRGKPEQKKQSKTDNIVFASHVDTYSLRKLIMQTNIIICRSGYSSIMDLIVLNKKAIIIPTPGQTEQEYLANYLSGRNLFFTCKQNDFNLEKMISGFKV